MPIYGLNVKDDRAAAIDWLSRPPDEVLAGKPVAIIGASPGRWGTRLAQSHLRHVLYATEALVMPGLPADLAAALAGLALSAYLLTWGSGAFFHNGLTIRGVRLSDGRPLWPTNSSGTPAEQPGRIYPPFPTIPNRLPPGVPVVGVPRPRRSESGYYLTTET